MPVNTQNMYQELDKVIETNKGQKGAVMMTLQSAQEIFGHVPKDVQIRIAEGLGVPLSEVYGVATFYSQFALDPRGQYIIGVCLGTACYVKGAQQVLDKFCEILNIQPGQTTSDGMFTIDALRCIGACGIAPAVTISGKVYPKVSVGSIPGIIEELRAKGGNQ